VILTILLENTIILDRHPEERPLGRDVRSMHSLFRALGAARRNTYIVTSVRKSGKPPHDDTVVAGCPVLAKLGRGSDCTVL
jgi:hypothetical protein